MTPYRLCLALPAIKVNFLRPRSTRQILLHTRHFSLVNPMAPSSLSKSLLPQVGQIIFSILLGKSVRIAQPLKATYHLKVAFQFFGRILQKVIRTGQEYSAK